MWEIILTVYVSTASTDLIFRLEFCFWLLSGSLLIRKKEWTTSFAVTSVPLWNFIPFLRWKIQVFSSVVSHFSARWPTYPPFSKL